MLGYLSNVSGRNVSIDNLNLLGVKTSVLFALGTHRPMTKNEMLKKLGLKIGRASCRERV